MRKLAAALAFALLIAAGCVAPDDKPTWQKTGLSAGKFDGSDFDVLNNNDVDTFEYRVKPSHGPVANNDN